MTGLDVRRSTLETHVRASYATCSWPLRFVSNIQHRTSNVNVPPFTAFSNPAPASGHPVASGVAIPCAPSWLTATAIPAGTTSCFSQAISCPIATRSSPICLLVESGFAYRSPSRPVPHDVADQHDLAPRGELDVHHSATPVCGPAHVSVRLPGQSARLAGNRRPGSGAHWRRRVPQRAADGPSTFAPAVCEDGLERDILFRPQVASATDVIPVFVGDHDQTGAAQAATIWS